MFAIPRSPFQWYEEHQWFRIITKFRVWSVSAFIYMCNPYGKHDEPILHYAYTAMLKENTGKNLFPLRLKLWLFGCTVTYVCVGSTLMCRNSY